MMVMMMMWGVVNLNKFNVEFLDSGESCKEI